MYRCESFDLKNNPLLSKYFTTCHQECKTFDYLEIFHRDYIGLCSDCARSIAAKRSESKGMAESKCPRYIPIRLLLLMALDHIKDTC
jgi:hypothetical protein